MSSSLLRHSAIITGEKRVEVASFAEVKESPTTGEKSLHATIPFVPGDILSTFAAQTILTAPHYLSFQISEQEHMLIDPEYLQYINHSCQPNVVFDISNKTVVCVQPIAVGEEITFFYPSTEWQMVQPFECFCQSPNCLGWIRGAAHLHPQILQAYKLSPFVQQKLM